MPYSKQLKKLMSIHGYSIPDGVRIQTVISEELYLEILEFAKANRYSISRAVYVLVEKQLAKKKK